jgi:hypothetical protein
MGMNDGMRNIGYKAGIYVNHEEELLTTILQIDEV